MWELLRYYRSLRGRKQDEWLSMLEMNGELLLEDGTHFPVDDAAVDSLAQYLQQSPTDLERALSSLRQEEQALAFCDELGVTVGTTPTQSEDHHQSPKALIGAVTYVAGEVCDELGLTLDENPQTRAVWCGLSGLHVTARNLDGAIPSLSNPAIVWEIKEYWGKTGGGSKMSDAVYECHLVGRELRAFEEQTERQIEHAVFVDGKIQWGTRKSDMTRFIDLFHQGLIDHLFVGSDVETEWGDTLRDLLSSS